MQDYVAFFSWEEAKEHLLWMIDKWGLPAAAARLSEWLTEHERKRLLKLIRRNLNT